MTLAVKVCFSSMPGGCASISDLIPEAAKPENPEADSFFTHFLTAKEASEMEILITF